MRATIPIGIQPGTKVIRIDRVPYTEQLAWEGNPPEPAYSVPIQGYWIIWIHSNPTQTLGTYLQLNDDGSIINVTVHEDGTEDQFTVKDADK